MDVLLVFWNMAGPDVDSMSMSIDAEKSELSGEGVTDAGVDSGVW